MLVQEEVYRANTVIVILSQEWRKTPEEVREIFKRGYSMEMNISDEGRRKEVSAMFPEKNPSAEEIIVRMGNELIVKYAGLSMTLNELLKCKDTIQQIAGKKKMDVETLKLELELYCSQNYLECDNPKTYFHEESSTEDANIENLLIVAASKIPESRPLDFKYPEKVY